jgi:ABC-type Fe3+-hydroxamate transport system substrate-binding protein
MRFIFTLALLFLINLGSLHAQVAKRIVSLAQSITKNIYLLEAQDKLVGCTSYCKTNKEDNIAVIGSAIKINIEKLYSLKPDLVITTGLTSPETLGMMDKLGIKYKIFESPKDFEGICKQFLEISKLIGKEEKGKKIVEQEKMKLQRLKKQIPAGKKPKIFIELGTKPLFSVIPNTFMHDYITFVGGENIATDVSTGILNREIVLQRNPDVIFVTTMGNIGAQEVKIWKKYSALKAAKNDQIFLIDSDIACTPTPDSYTATVEKMIELMYGR